MSFDAQDPEAYNLELEMSQLSRSIFVPVTGMENIPRNGGDFPEIDILVE